MPPKKEEERESNDFQSKQHKDFFLRMNKNITYLITVLKNY